MAHLHKGGCRGEGLPRSCESGPGPSPHDAAALPAESAELRFPLGLASRSQRSPSSSRGALGSLPARVSPGGDRPARPPLPEAGRDAGSGRGARQARREPPAPASWLPAVPGSGRGLQEVAQTRRAVGWAGGGPR